MTDAKGPALRDGPEKSRWSDLSSRALSALVLLAIGVAEIWLGGTTFAVLVVLLITVMIWELARMTDLAGSDPGWMPILHAGLAGAVLILTLLLPKGIAPLLLVLPGVFLWFPPGRDRPLRAVYALLIMVAGYGLVDLRGVAGPVAILWLVGVVVASDVLGYFVGRTFGGPKFWPRVSPKKTWSGTIAGWVGGGLVGLGFVIFIGAQWLLVPVSAMVAYAGQLGDITESWIKRRAGVKDASSVIPGHGGVLDRFDALIGAVVLLWVLQPVLTLATLVAG
ncbi:MAG: hypothetical protein B7Z10_01180 [Rhodobacterales bacterium 32-66-7]|nr:MAG: hypothetical protein B7Z10_01180 [Rhodobacterales bacterium 32-66-7]